uniref:Lipocalin/cytosolic fatty-acid binding domain-containing protein n=1 Tax=Anopheles atroparvus TaxID=41427 RepID=A0A182JKD6_ANOAO
MFSASIYTVLLTVFIGSWQVEGFVVKDGNCSIMSTKVPYVKNFQIEKYLGVWYERERYEQPYERNQECVTTEYRSSQPVGMLEVKTRGLLPTNETFQAFSSIGTFSEEPSENGEWNAKLNMSFGAGWNETIYYIVDTDYGNYAIVYSCTSFPETDQSVEGYWLLSRTRKPITDPTMLDRVTKLRSTYFELSHMRATNQTEALCPSESTLPPAPSSVILPPV